MCDFISHVERSLKTRLTVSLMPAQRLAKHKVGPSSALLPVLQGMELLHVDLQYANCTDISTEYVIILYLFVIFHHT